MALQYSYNSTILQTKSIIKLKIEKTSFISSTVNAINLTSLEFLDFSTCELSNTKTKKKEETVQKLKKNMWMYWYTDPQYKSKRL